MTWKHFSPLTGNFQPVHLMAFDTEDNGSGASRNFICASFYSPHYQKITFDKEEAQRITFSMNSRLPRYFVSHNLAYDLMNLGYDPQKNIGLQFNFAKSKLINAVLKRNKKTRRFIDSGNFFIATSLSKIGQALKMYKGDYDTKFLRGKTPDDLSEKEKKEVGEYCLHDSKICYQAMQSILSMCEELNIKFRSNTAASLALRIFRKNFLKETWYKRPQEINNFEREAYYGGRCEVFSQKKYDLVYMEDISSSYPFQMSTYMFPHPNSYRKIRNSTWDHVKEYEGVSRVIVKAPRIHIPVLATKYNDRLVFPTGRWEGTYTHVELRYAEEKGYEFELLDTLIYTKLFNPFKDYVNYWYEKKSGASGIWREIYKHMMNDLSGKFGEARHEVLKGHIDSLKFCTCAHHDKKICLKCKGVNARLLDPSKGPWVSVIGDRIEDPKNSFPLLIAYITSHARIQLHKRLSSAKTAIYCDTDSVVSLEPPEEDIGNKLGQWERKVLYNFQAVIPKVYTANEYPGKINHKEFMNLDFGWKDYRRMKGVPLARAKLVESTSDYDRYEYESPLKYGEALRRKMDPNTWIIATKTISKIDSKRIHSNGNSDPITLNLVSEDE